MLQEATDVEDDFLRLIVLGAFDENAAVMYKGCVLASPDPAEKSADAYASQAACLRESSTCCRTDAFLKAAACPGATARAAEEGC